MLTGCSFVEGLKKYSPEEYHNSIVNQINISSPLIKETGTLYTSTIPDVVTEQDEIDTTEMKKAYEEAVKELEKMEPLLDLESRNEEQQQSAREGIELYIESANQYLAAFGTTLEYYSSEAYKEDISQVETMDENLHNLYSVFIEANNDLSTTLENFVIEENPVEEAQTE